MHIAYTKADIDGSFEWGQSMAILRFSLLKGLKNIRSNGKHFVQGEEINKNYRLGDQMTLSGL